MQMPAWNLWQEVAQAKDTWTFFTAAFGQKLVNVARPAIVPCGRSKIRETPDLFDVYSKVKHSGQRSTSHAASTHMHAPPLAEENKL